MLRLPVEQVSCMQSIATQQEKGIYRRTNNSLQPKWCVNDCGPRGSNIMSTQEEHATTTTAPDPPLLFVGQQETSRLLEVYVKRSLSLNDGSPYVPRQARGKQRKWVTLEERKRRKACRRHSSDTSLHLSIDKEDLEEGAEEEEDNTFGAACDDPAGPGGGAAKLQLGDKAGRQKWNTLRTRWKSFRDKGSRRPSNKPSKTANLVKPSSDSEDNKVHEPKTPAGTDLESSAEKPKGKPEGSQSKPSGRKKDKKPKTSFWKSIIGFFSPRGDSDTDVECDPSTARTVEEPLQPDEPLPSPPVTCLPLPKAFPDSREGSPRRKKTMKKRRSRRKLSLKLDRPSSLVIEGVERVESTVSYYENVSEELKKIVTEVKESPTDEHAVFPPGTPTPPDNNNCQCLSAEEVVERLIYLIKEEGDALNAKIQDNPSLVSYFQGLTYGSFQQLADQYVQSEIPTQPVLPGPGPVVAPELVKLAFTLDFTARLASLSRQSPSHIMGLGSRYLQDRFTYTEPQPMTPTTGEPPGGPGPGEEIIPNGTQPHFT
ncbi:uncharacterized protein LOC134462255 [Engraulis encrasicolus]|uniref:uncharacterized protein LOC134462255 n=1 Tax=Engraulis encrasicolus TaxID=184585 RepID=UPI002FD70FB2